MKIYTFEDLLHKDFNVVFVNALQQFWHMTKSFQCIGKPKTENLLLFINGCKIIYTDKAGNKVMATDTDVVYTPIGSEYKARLSDFQSSNSHTVGINFYLYDKDGEPIVLSDSIKIFHNTQNKALSMLFHRALRFDTLDCYIENRILLMEIFSQLRFPASRKFVPNYIDDTVQYLAEHLEENPTVKELAERCNISEVYFRKQFRKYMGINPLGYRNSLRLERARAYLEYGEISVQEISNTLGYSTVSHFIKEYKRQYGCSPHKYRKIIRSSAN